ncbi:MAG: PASTA domain-containing protein [Oscillospiraceae bacterium]|jgi:stage V sporulation protein D (sporulation-specific penicillin-binding protein)|nr:PASTA domain-containing protein [Oscillospiraceae bacterium]
MKTVVRQPDDKPTGTVLNRTFWLLIFCGIAAFLALGYNLFKLQVIRHGEFESKAIDQQTREAVVKAARGTIYDRSGKVLAVSATAETVYLDPFLLAKNGENASEISDALSALLGLDRESIYEKYANTKQRGLPVKRKIEGEEAKGVREYIVANKLTSVYLAEDTKRYYPQSSLASGVIGFVGTDNYGLEGVEARYDDYLTGTDGRVVRLKNVSGTDMLFGDYENYFDAENGGDITLTLDSTIQYYVEKHLTQAIEDFDIQSGAAAIAINPKTAEILAMATFGNYDLNAPFDVSEDILATLDGLPDEERAAGLAAARTAQWRNKAISDTYEPGSVFKTITLAIALEEGLINENSTFYCGGSYSGVPGRPVDNPYHCWKSGGHGTQTLSEAVQNSCNVAFVNIGMQIGAERFYKYIEAFGFKEKTGFDLPGEASSLWWSDTEFMNPKDKTELASASFGQTFNITPLQLVTAISAAVNGGQMYTPHIVKTIKDPAGNIIKSVDPEPVRQVISEKTSATVRKILEDVVAVGTGRNAQVAGYRVGGKTGTSTNTVIQAETEQKKYIVSFCGVAPMDDPQILVLVLLDNPSNKSGVYISGGNMGAPTVGNILSDVLPYLGIAPQYTEDEAKQLNVTVPKLISSTAEDAKKTLEKAGLSVRTVGDGDTVTGQMPSVNAVVSPGTKVVIYLGADMPDNSAVTVPSVTGRGYYEAKNALESAGLFIRSTGVPATATGAAVSVQSIPSGTEVEYGSVVEVTLVDKSIQGQY